LGNLLPRKKQSIYFDKKSIGLHFGRFFSQTHLVTLLKTCFRSGREHGDDSAVVQLLEPI
jgi:hypothetical protein